MLTKFELQCVEYVHGQRFEANTMLASAEGVVPLVHGNKVASVTA